MKLVVDANVLFSFFKVDSFTRKFIFSHPELELFTPVYVFEELERHKGEIKSKSNINDEIFKLTEKRLLAYIESVPSAEFKELWAEASQISPDPDDAAYFALGLKLDCPIWSRDEELGKRQSEVRVLSTSELVELLEF